MPRPSGSRDQAQPEACRAFHSPAKSADLPRAYPRIGNRVSGGKDQAESTGQQLEQGRLVDQCLVVSGSPGFSSVSSRLRRITRECKTTLLNHQVLHERRVRMR